MIATNQPKPKTKKQQDAENKERMVKALTTHKDADKFVERALLALYERQTQDEQQSGYTEHHNGIGFTGTDAEFLTSLAQGVIKSRDVYKKPEGQRLTVNQRAICRNKLQKYWRQLVEVAEQKAKAVVH